MKANGYLRVEQNRLFKKPMVHFVVWFGWC